jgi:NAD(P)H-dependent FMN reductase
MGAAHQVLLICGSLRSGSTHAAVLRAVRELAPEGVDCVVYDGLARLPPFNPDDDVEPLHPAVADMRQRMSAADAVLFCTPEYAGALPGAFKNLLDWSVGGGLYAKPVAWINASVGPTDAADAHESLRKVLGYISADLVETACAKIPVLRQSVDGEGRIPDPAIRAQLAAVVPALIAHVEAAGRAGHDAAPAG